MLLIAPFGAVSAQSVPEMIEYTMVYDFLDELASDGIIDVTEAVRPYYRDQIAQLLYEAMLKQDSVLPNGKPMMNARQREELQFYIQDYALELDTMPDYKIYGHNNVCQWTSRGKEAVPVQWNLALVDPSLHLMTNDHVFKMRIRPILGMDIYASKKGNVLHRWYGAEVQMDIASHLSIWGSLRDNSWSGLGINGSRLTQPEFLNNFAGVQYKEASYGGDFSDSRGGIALYAWWGRIAIQRDRLQWGDAQLSSNILSAHNPAVPMITLQLTPCKWFQFDYFHAWLVSNVIDSTYYYQERWKESEIKTHYRPANKFMAANLFTFKPIKYIHFSFGNSIIYSERNVQAAYFIPIAFYKSLDHLLTKGLAVENQNSQIFASVTIRPTDHLRIYGTFFVDEFKLDRLKRSNPENNPISYLVGFNWSGWPVKGLSLKGEFMRSYIACYTHSISVSSFRSNSYTMGHYMNDNAQSIFMELAYRPVRGLSLKLNYTLDTKYNVYDYVRYYIAKDKDTGGLGIIAQKPFNEKTWQNAQIGFKAVYEIFNNCYAHVDLLYNHAQSFAPSSVRVSGEDRGWNADGSSMNLSGAALQEYYLNKFTPSYFQGRNFTATMGLSFGF